MIVVDTNLVAFLVLPGARSTLAEEVLERDPQWAAPLLWRSEFRNILAGSVKRRGLALEDALRVVTHAEGLLRGREHAVRSDEVLRLAVESGCTAYDCEFVAVAARLRVPLVTSDEEILASFRSIALSPERFVRGER